MLNSISFHLTSSADWTGQWKSVCKYESCFWSTTELLIIYTKSCHHHNRQTQTILTKLFSKSLDIPFHNNNHNFKRHQNWHKLGQLLATAAWLRLATSDRQHWVLESRGYAALVSTLCMHRSASRAATMRASAFVLPTPRHRITGSVDSWTKHCCWPACSQIQRRMLTSTTHLHFHRATTLQTLWNSVMICGSPHHFNWYSTCVT